jgi:hypothetical protein
LGRFAAHAREAQAAKVIRLGGFDSAPVMPVGGLARNIECAKPCRQNQTPRGLRQPPDAIRLHHPPGARPIQLKFAFPENYNRINLPP